MFPPSSLQMEAAHSSQEDIIFIVTTIRISNLIAKINLEKGEKHI
jgi:hypothetical protein